MLNGIIGQRLRRTRLRGTPLLIALAAPILVSAGAAYSQEVPAHPTGDIPPELIQLRSDFINSPLNMLAYQHIDSIFHTAPVKTCSGSSRQVWSLDRAEAPLSFTYEFAGQTYTPEQFLSRNKTNALLVIKFGEIVYENYLNFSTPETQFLSMSMAKSITSILIGAALQDGLIDSLDEQIVTYVPELAGTGYDGVTIRDALRMRTGIAREEDYSVDPDNPSEWWKWREATIIRNQRRVAEQALLMKRAIQPGSKFEYSTLDTVVLGWVLERAIGGKSISEYMSERIWQPLGAEADGSWVLDGPIGVGREHNGMGFNATLRDYGRLGLMMLNKGQANGRQILTEEWVRESTVSQPGELTAPGAPTGYQYQWWTLADTRAYVAIGYDGQFIYVDPDTETVIVKMGYYPDEPGPYNEEAFAFFKAVSAWKN